MIISIASDHAGFQLKQYFIEYLEAKGYEVTDRGPYNDERVDYPDYAALVAKDITTAAAERGILICGTGIGMSIAANKFKAVRAANVTHPDFAVLTREHNDANILCLSARFVDTTTNEKIVDTFLGTDFLGGRHAERVAKIEKLSL